MDENSQFKKLRDVSLPSPGSSLNPSHPPICPAEIAARRAALLLGCYRRGDAEDPETYSAAVALILAEYPMPIVYRVTDPRSGLPGRCQWLPTVAEVRAACEAQMPPKRPLTAAQVASSVPAHDRKSVLDDLAEKHPELFAGYRARWGAGAKTNG